MRGNRRLLQWRDHQHRSIPARAGEPWRTGCRPWPGWVYPRACGGTALETTLLEYVQGLSPRVRGNHPRCLCGGRPERSIPARAGEPNAGTVMGRAFRVYPRACGGTKQGAQGGISVTGLSPRVRGNLALPTLPAVQWRSIPARAGEPAVCRAQHPTYWVYPRACGGTVTIDLVQGGGNGLSPRVRGNHLRWRIDRHCPGSIPARAGEPYGTRPTRNTYRVYPRACGGTACGDDLFVSFSGLSPRVRGNL